MKKQIVKVVFLALLITACSELSTSELLVKAKGTYQEKNYAETIILTKNVIRNTPNSIEARILIADSYYQLGFFLDAEKEYSKAQELGASLEKIITNYSRALYGSDDYQVIIDLWTKNKDSLSDVKKAEVAPIVSLSYLKQSNTQKSFEIANASNELAIKSGVQELIDVNSALSNTYKQPIDIHTTISELSKACLTYDEQWISCYMLANAYFSQGQYDNAAEIFEKVLNSKPNYNPIIIRLADSYVRGSDDEKANRFVFALQKNYPDHPYVNLLTATLRLRSQEFELALNHINTTINKGMTTPQAKLTASIIHYNLGNDEQAIFHLKSLKTAYPDNLLITKLYIALQLRSGDATSITNAYSNTSPSKENTELFALASLELIKNGEYLNSVELINKIDTSLIEDQKILNSISIAKLASGNQTGIEDLERSLSKLRSNGSNSGEISKVKMLLISSLIANKQHDKADNYVNSWIAKEPKNIDNKLLLTRLENLKQVPNKIKLENIYQSIISVDKHNPTANLYFALQFTDKGDYKSAETFLDNALEVHSNNILVVANYLNLKQKMVGEASALKALVKHYNNYENDFAQRITLAQIYLLAKQPKNVLDLVKDIPIPAQSNQQVVHSIMAQAYTGVKDFENAIKIYLKMLENNSQDKQIIEKLALAYESSGDLKSAISAFESMHNQYKSNTQIGLILANYYIVDGQHSLAIDYIDSLSSEQQSHPIIMGIRGKALYFAKVYDQALISLSESYKKANNGKLVPFIFDSNIKLSKIQDAIDFMDEYLRLHPNDSSNRVYYANELYKLDKGKAINEYENVLAKDQKSIIALNNIAWLLYEDGEFSKAKTYIDKAVALAPSNKDVKDTLSKITTALNNNN